MVRDGSRHVSIPVLTTGRTLELPNSEAALNVGGRLLRDLNADCLDDAHRPSLGAAGYLADGLFLEAVPRGTLKHELGPGAVSPRCTAELGGPRGARQDRDSVVVFPGARCRAKGLTDGSDSAREEGGNGHNIGGNDIKTLHETILSISI